MEKFIGISSVKQLLVYLEELKKLENCIITVCMKDTAGFWLDEEVQSGLEELGLKENLVKELMVGYIGIIENGVPIYEKKTPNSSEEYDGEIGGHRFHIVSAPFNSGNTASVEIDGTEYAMGKRGLNFVIFDKTSSQVIDTVAFDTHVQNYACNRMKKHYDVGVLGCWFGSNYGSCLNGFAVYKVLKSLNQSVLMINKPNAVRNDWEIVGTHNARFIDKFYAPDEVSPCFSSKEMTELNNYCDTFLTGSDQIWNYFINNIFDFTFMQSFVSDSKKKISFGTSFGKAVDITPKEKLPYTKKLLRRYNAVSLREESGVKICRDVYGVKAKAVVEPVFCLKKEQYEEIAETSEIKKEEPYIVTYMLDPTEEKRRAIQYYCEESGMKAYNILDGDPRVYDKNNKILDLPDTMGKIGAEDFLRLYQNASLVITDSFHGTAFAIIFNKPFISITNQKRGSVRFNELLGKFGLLERLVEDSENIPHDPKYFEAIDFEKANEIMEDERNSSIEWLKNVVETPVEKLPPILIENKSITANLDMTMCMGCGACVSSCPVSCLRLQPDADGYYRSTNDYNKCINCGVCAAVCPARKLPKNTNTKEPELIEFRASDEEVIYKSSSGGIFTVLANEAFRRNGVVVGAAWNENLDDEPIVEHIMIESPEELHKLQKSKYLQSYTGDIFRNVKEKLDNGTFVLFTGTPCQVTGLKSYLRKDYDNLIAVDLLCGNAPSAGFFKKYLRDSFPEGIREYEFRYKSEKFVWDSNVVKVVKADGSEEIRKGGRDDDYQRVYHNHTMCSKHCENCRYQSVPRFGDITIGDFWGIGSKEKTLNTSKGVSAILCSNPKGKAFLDSLPKDEIEIMKKVPLNWLGKNGWAINNSHNFVSPKRNEFYKAVKTMPFSQAINYALKPNHGTYDADSRYPLHFKSKKFFNFDANVWEEHIVKDCVVLTVKNGQAKPGMFAAMPLNRMLEKGKKYTLSIRFRVKTKSDWLNFHLKDSGSDIWQVIQYCKMSNYNQNDWIEITKDFVPNANFYDEFMLGASQIKGEDAYIAFDYISIKEQE